jgi:hypothetical protein
MCGMHQLCSGAQPLGWQPLLDNPHDNIAVFLTLADNKQYVVQTTKTTNISWFFEQPISKYFHGLQRIQSDITVTMTSSQPNAVPGPPLSFAAPSHPGLIISLPPHTTLVDNVLRVRCRSQRPSAFGAGQSQLAMSTFGEIETEGCPAPCRPCPSLHGRGCCC